MLSIGAPAAPVVDVRIFLPQLVLVPILAVPPVAVRLPASPSGLNYIATSRTTTEVIAFAPTNVPGAVPAVSNASSGPVAGTSGNPAVAGTSGNPAVAGTSGTPAVAGTSGNPAVAAGVDAAPAEAAPAGPNGSRRAQDGVTRSLLGPLDVIVVNGGINLGIRAVVAE